MNQAGRAEAKRIFLTPVGLYIFVHPVVFLVHDPYNHVGLFFALQKAQIKKMPNPPPSAEADITDKRHDKRVKAFDPSVLNLLL